MNKFFPSLHTLSKNICELLLQRQVHNNITQRSIWKKKQIWSETVLFKFHKKSLKKWTQSPQNKIAQIFCIVSREIIHNKIGYHKRFPLYIVTVKNFGQNPFELNSQDALKSTSTKTVLSLLLHNITFPILYYLAQSHGKSRAVRIAFWISS